MVFEGANGMFGSIFVMFLGRDMLELDLVLLEVVFEILGALVVKYVQGGGVALLEELFVSVFPGTTDASSLAVGNGSGMNGVCVLVVSGCHSWKGLETCRFGEDFRVQEQEGTNLMGVWF